MTPKIETAFDDRRGDDPTPLLLKGRKRQSRHVWSISESIRQYLMVVDADPIGMEHHFGSTLGVPTG